MSRSPGRWVARSVLVRLARGKPRTRLERLPHPMTPKELHAWVRGRYGDKAAHWARDVDWEPVA